MNALAFLLRGRAGGSSAGGAVTSPSGPITGALSIYGRKFRNPDGSTWKCQGVGGFNALELWLRGERGRLDDFAGWCIDHHVNAWVYFTMWAYGEFGAFGPTVTANYSYDAINDLHLWMERAGIRPIPTGFCDQIKDSPILLSQAQALWHHTHMSLLVQGRLYRFMNEPFKNGLDLCKRLPPVPGALSCRGQIESWTADGAGPPLEWSAILYDRKFQWPRTAKDGMAFAEDIARVPCIGLEPPVGMLGHDVDFSRSRDPRKHADWHALAYGTSNGSCMHGDPANLQFCRVPDADTEPCADAITAVWTCGIPVDAADGQYTRGGPDAPAPCPLVHSDRYDDGSGEINPAGCERTFAKITGNTATCFLVQPGAAYPGPQGANGWTVVNQIGPHEQIVFAQR